MKKTVRTFISTLIVTAALLLPLTIAHAALSIDPELHPDNAPQGYYELAGVNDDNSENFSDIAITRIIADVAVVLLQISGSLTILFIIFNAFNYVKSFGQDEQIEKAKKGLMWSILGFLVILLSYAIVQNVIKITLSVDAQ